MSSVPLRPTPEPEKDERRSHPRRRLDRLAYIGFGPDIGGVLLDVSEGGLRCQIVGSVVEGDLCHVKFALPGRSSRIEADGQVVWSNSSKQGGGVRLIGLRPDVRRDIEQWIHDEIAAESSRKPASIPIRIKKIIAEAPQTSAPASAVSASQEKDTPAPVEPKLHVVPASPRPKAVPEIRRHKAKAARKQAAAKGIASKPPARATPVARLPELTIENRTGFPIKLAVLAGCVIAGLLAFEFPALNPAGLISASSTIVTAPAAAPPSATDASAQPDESPNPTVADSATGYDSRRINQTTRPEVVAANPVRDNRPAQTPKAPAAKPANRRQMALVPPRPHATNLAAATVAPPDLAAAPVATSIDMSMLDGRLPEPPTPAKPQVVIDYKLPQLISRVEPVYSMPARQARLQGPVTIDVTVGADGTARSSVCVEGNALLCRMATDAIAKWRFQPATSNGLPVDAQTRFSFNFQLR